MKNKINELPEEWRVSKCLTCVSNIDIVIITKYPQQTKQFCQLCTNYAKKFVTLCAWNLKMIPFSYYNERLQQSIFKQTLTYKASQWLLIIIVITDKIHTLWLSRRGYYSYRSYDGSKKMHTYTVIVWFVFVI